MQPLAGLDNKLIVNEVQPRAIAVFVVLDFTFAGTVIAQCSRQ